MLAKKYSFTLDYKNFYEILDIDGFVKEIADSGSNVGKEIMVCNFSVMKTIELSEKAIETGVTMGEILNTVLPKPSFDTESIRNTYETFFVYFKKILSEEDFKALEQECLMEYAEKCMDVITDLESILRQQNNV